MITLTRIWRAIKNPKKAFKYLSDLVEHRQFIKDCFESKQEYLIYRNEIVKDDLIEKLNQKKKLFQNQIKGKTYRGNLYNFGEMSNEEGIRLYCLIRKLKPKKSIETGVCNGASSAFILAAIKRNGFGKLYSIDLPELANTNYQGGYFWEGKGGAVVPRDELPGWIIPDDLRDNWELILGKTIEKLPPLIKKLDDIDFFMHDSEHSYECMKFEYNLAYEILNLGGILLSHDIQWNNAFSEFARKKRKRVINLKNTVGLIIK